MHTPEASSPSPRLPGHIVAALVLMLAAALAAIVMRPHIYMAKQKPPLSLETQIPQHFADWKIDRTQDIILPDPEVQAKLDKLYTQTLSRTYVNSAGQQIMLSVAYGSDQSNEATAAHRPEFCYEGAGFRVTRVRSEPFTVPGGRALSIQRLMAQRGDNEFEPVSYWVTLDEHAALPGLSRKLEQFSYGLRGLIPDGMLVRVSSRGKNQEVEYALQDKFLSDLAKTMPATYRPRYFGS